MKHESLAAGLCRELGGCHGADRNLESLVDDVQNVVDATQVESSSRAAKMMMASVCVPGREDGKLALIT
jgi:hypothetical protein